MCANVSRYTNKTIDTNTTCTLINASKDCTTIAIITANITLVISAVGEAVADIADHI